MRKLLTAAIMAVSSIMLCGCRGSESIFNGRDLEGWVCVTSSEDSVSSEAGPTFSVVDGALHISGHPFGYIRTAKSYSDYVLTLEWRWAGEKRADSGIFNRIQEGDKVWPAGVQCQMRESDFGFFFSPLPLEGVEGDGFYRKGNLCKSDPELPDGEWNTAEFTCKGSHISAVVNGVLVNEADCSATEGYIGFQSEGGAIEFRSIRLRKL